MTKRNTSFKDITIKIWRFLKDHPILSNLGLIFITGIIIIWFWMIFLGVWTGHGDVRIVPDVTGTAFDEAIETLDNNDLTIEISDSIYDTDRKPGTIIRQSPNPEMPVKPGRTVYVSIISYGVKHIKIPAFENMPTQAGRELFSSLGFENIQLKEVESEHRDLLISATYNGKKLTQGMRIPVNAKIVLEIGKGLSASQQDSLQIAIMQDSLRMARLDSILF